MRMPINQVKDYLNQQANYIMKSYNIRGNLLLYIQQENHVMVMCYISYNLIVCWLIAILIHELIIIHQI